MDINLLYQIYFNCDLKSKEEVYSFISEIVCEGDFQQKEKIIHQLEEREKVGSTLIAEHVMLPHIESDQIKMSQIIFIRLANPILSWNSQTKDIRLLIIILLKEKENDQVKKKVSLFTRTLADEEYLNRLVTINEKEKFHKEIKRI